MKKCLLSLIMVLCCLLTLLAACGSQEDAEPLTAAQAIQIVLDDLDMTVDEALPHIHTGTYEGADCYNIYVTVNGQSLAYTVHSITGEILLIEESSHSH